jgi:hypothetical protein
MDVYLIPVGALGKNEYELYCEHVEDETVSPDVPDGSGRLAGIYHRFKAAVAHAELEGQRGHTEPEDEPLGWNDRIKRRMLRWIAEKVAEQRLLWRIRKESTVTLYFPDDLTSEESLALARSKLQREADHHLKWAIIDGILLCISGIAVVVPGPNALAYYFGFRFVGHYLSRRGAKHALDEVLWQCQSSEHLSVLRRAIPLEARERERRVHEVAAALRLQHLAIFFERTAVPSA